MKYFVLTGDMPGSWASLSPSTPPTRGYLPEGSHVIGNPNVVVGRVTVESFESNSYATIKWLSDVSLRRLPRGVYAYTPLDTGEINSLYVLARANPDSRFIYEPIRVVKTGHEGEINLNAILVLKQLYNIEFRDPASLSVVMLYTRGFPVAGCSEVYGEMETWVGNMRYPACPHVVLKIYGKLQRELQVTMTGDGYVSCPAMPPEADPYVELSRRRGIPFWSTPYKPVSPVPIPVAVGTSKPPLKPLQREPEPEQAEGEGEDIDISPGEDVET